MIPHESPVEMPQIELNERITRSSYYNQSRGKCFFLSSGKGLLFDLIHTAVIHFKSCIYVFETFEDCKQVFFHPSHFQDGFLKLIEPIFHFV